MSEIIINGEIFEIGKNAKCLNKSFKDVFWKLSLEERVFIKTKIEGLLEDSTKMVKELNEHNCKVREFVGCCRTVKGWEETDIQVLASPATISNM